MSEETYLTVTVTGSKILRRADGSTAILFRFEKGPPIAFAVDLQNLAQLRVEIAKAEQFLNQAAGAA